MEIVCSAIKAFDDVVVFALTVEGLAAATLTQILGALVGGLPHGSAELLSFL